MRRLLVGLLALCSMIFVAACGTSDTAETVEQAERALSNTYSSPVFRWAPIDASPWEWDGKSVAGGNRDSAALFCRWKGYQYTWDWSVELGDPNPGRYRFSTKTPGSDPTWCEFCRWKFAHITCADSPPTPPLCAGCSAPQYCCIDCDGTSACVTSGAQCRRIQQGHGC